MSFQVSEMHRGVKGEPSPDKNTKQGGKEREKRNKKQKKTRREVPRSVNQWHRQEFPRNCECIAREAHALLAA